MCARMRVCACVVLVSWCHSPPASPSATAGTTGTAARPNAFPDRLLLCCPGRPQAQGARTTDVPTVPGSENEGQESSRASLGSAHSMRSQELHQLGARRLLRAVPRETRALGWSLHLQLQRIPDKFYEDLVFLVGRGLVRNISFELKLGKTPREKYLRWIITDLEAQKCTLLTQKSRVGHPHSLVVKVWEWIPYGPPRLKFRPQAPT